jgi:hypothetical protein
MAILGMCSARDASERGSGRGGVVVSREQFLGVPGDRNPRRHDGGTNHLARLALQP